jgi:hypothetical protein
MYNYLLKHVFEVKIGGRREIMGRQRKCKKLLIVLKEKTGYCKLKEEALEDTLWKTRFGRFYGCVVRQTTE